MTASRTVPDEIARIAERSDAQAWADICVAAPPAVARTCGIALHRHGSAVAGLASKIDVIALNRIVNLGMDERATERQLDNLIAHYHAARVPRFFVQLSPNAGPPALAEWLRARGLEPYNAWVKLYRGMRPPPEVATDLRIEAIGPEYSKDFARLVQTSFGWPDAACSWIAAAVGRDHWRHYMAFDGAAPAAGAALYFSGGYAWLGFAATLTAYRNRGAQSALIARRIGEAIKLGVSCLITETAEDRPEHPAPSYHNMRRMGFQIAYLRPNYVFKRSEVRPTEVQRDAA